MIYNDIKRKHIEAKQKIPLQSQEHDCLHQLFITKNPILRKQVQSKFYRWISSENKERMESAVADLVPQKLTDFEDEDYPQFLTSRQLLLLLDLSVEGSLDGALEDSSEQSAFSFTFIPRHADGSLSVQIENADVDYELDTLLDQNFTPESLTRPGDTKGVKTMIEITGSLFVHEIWNKITQPNERGLDPLLIWMEIRSFIKGSIEALKSPNGFLSYSAYSNIGNKKAPNFKNVKEKIYKIFQSYKEYLQNKRYEENYFDECDLVHHIYQRLCKLDNEPKWVIHNVYIDEVQDFTEAELYLFACLCRYPNGNYFTGDTAQSIMRGVSFRFKDLKTLYHKLLHDFGSQLSISVPDDPKWLLHSYRSHAGLINMSTSIISLLDHFFPESFDSSPLTKVTISPANELKPVLIQTTNEDELLFLLAGSKECEVPIEFGARQAIIVQSEEAKKTIPKKLKDASPNVLTIFQAKGLEFDDVLLYNFFHDSLVEKEWRLVMNYQYKSRENLPEQRMGMFGIIPGPIVEGFDEAAHKSLNSELKILYTAVTRARCNLWIYDINHEKRNPMFYYWFWNGYTRHLNIDDHVDGNVAFATSSPADQWEDQGSYFLNKHMWEEAMHCFMKAEALHRYKETQAYKFFAMKIYELAATKFLESYQLRHSITILQKAAVCMMKAKTHYQAGLLLEKLGKNEMAFEEFVRAKKVKDYVRLGEKLNKHDTIIEILQQHDPFLALRKLVKYEEEGKTTKSTKSHIAFVCTKSNLASQSQHVIENVTKLVHAEIRVKCLKAAGLFEHAVEQCLLLGDRDEADEIMIAHGMYRKAIEVAQNEKTKWQFILMNARAYMSTNQYLETTIADELQEIICKERQDLLQAEALLLHGRLSKMEDSYKKALKLFEKLNNLTGVLQSFNEIGALNPDMLKGDPLYTLKKCAQAYKMHIAFKTNENKRKPLQQSLVITSLHFYQFQKVKGKLVIHPSQNIWITEPDLHSGNTLHSGFVEQALAQHFFQMCKKWIADGRIVSSYLESVPQQLTSISSKNLKEYCEFLVLACSVPLSDVVQEKLYTLISSFFHASLLFRFPFTKLHFLMFQRSDSFRTMIQRRSQALLPASHGTDIPLDNLFEAWRIHCVASGHSQGLQQLLTSDRFMRSSPFTWTDMDKKSFEHVFSYWLGPCELIAHDEGLIYTIKERIYKGLLIPIATRKDVRQTISELNVLFVVNVCTCALFYIFSICGNTSVYIPKVFMDAIQTFDILNAQVGNRAYLQNACREEVTSWASRYQHGELKTKVTESLQCLLNLLLGFDFSQFNLLSKCLSSESCHQDGSGVYCLSFVLMLIANLSLLGNDERYFNRCFREVLVQLHLCQSIAGIPSYVKYAFDSMEGSYRLSTLFKTIQHLLGVQHQSQTIVIVKFSHQMHQIQTYAKQAQEFPQKVFESIEMVSILAKAKEYTSAASKAAPMKHKANSFQRDTMPLGCADISKALFESEYEGSYRTNQGEMKQYEGHEDSRSKFESTLALEEDRSESRKEKLHVEDKDGKEIFATQPQGMDEVTRTQATSEVKVTSKEYGTPPSMPVSMEKQQVVDYIAAKGDHTHADQDYQVPPSIGSGVGIDYGSDQKQLEEHIAKYVSGNQCNVCGLTLEIEPPEVIPSTSMPEEQSPVQGYETHLKSHAHKMQVLRYEKFTSNIKKYQKAADTLRNTLDDVKETDERVAAKLQQFEKNLDQIIKKIESLRGSYKWDVEQLNKDTTAIQAMGLELKAKYLSKPQFTSQASRSNENLDSEVDEDILPKIILV